MPSLARSVSKPPIVPSLARSVPKPLKVPSLARSVAKPCVGEAGGLQTRRYIVVDPYQLVVGCEVRVSTLQSKL